jgi:hypothetical protein
MPRIELLAIQRLLHQLQRGRHARRSRLPMSRGSRRYGPQMSPGAPRRRSTSSPLTTRQNGPSPGRTAKSFRCVSLR